MEEKKRIEKFIRIAYDNNTPNEEYKTTFFHEPLIGESQQDMKNATALLLDLEKTPHAFVLGCVMNLQVQVEKAWIIPFKVFDAFLKMGLIENNSIDELAKVSPEKYKEVFLYHYGKSLHRFDYMVGRFYNAVIHIKNKYQGDASKIWSNKPSSKEVVREFLEFEGVGQKISNMAANLLFRKLGIDFSEYSCIDISLDRHIICVMKRLGLIEYGNDEEKFKENILEKTRVWNPEYPGIFDSVCFFTGRDYCHENKMPNCDYCTLKDVCNKNI